MLLYNQDWGSHRPGSNSCQLMIKYRKDAVAGIAVWRSLRLGWTHREFWGIIQPRFVCL